MCLNNWKCRTLTYTLIDIIWLVGKLDGVEFKNNIFDFRRTKQKLHGPIDEVLFNYNCYFASSGSCKIFEDYKFQDLKFGLTDFEPNGFWADPLFISSGRQEPSNFQLSVNSPCLNNGDSVALSFDFQYNRRGFDGKWDIGAFECEF